MKVGVVGGGIFGCTAAIQAARQGFDVHLHEELGDIMQAASFINQYRLHRGYHYPRSSQTAMSALAAEVSFREEYGEAVIDGGNHLYAIAKEKSLVTADQFLAFCAAHDLAYEPTEAKGIVNSDMVDIVIRASEGRFDPHELKAIVAQKLDDAGVEVHRNSRADAEILERYDKVILATYARTGILAEELIGTELALQFEVCEKPVVKLPPYFGRTDLVIMDGPFMCVDPIGRSDTYALGNVVHAIHAQNVGSAPIIPDVLRPLVNRGVLPRPPVTKFQKFIEAGSVFIPALSEAEYVGSMFTIRTVLPGQDATDARPTMVTALDEKFIQIFSGKIGNSVLAAKEAVALLAAIPTSEGILGA